MIKLGKFPKGFLWGGAVAANQLDGMKVAKVGV